MWAAILPVAGAVGVFGAIYGAAAQPVLGAPLTLLSSVVIFSGAAQFSMVGLLAAGTSPVAVLGAVAVLGLRHLVLGAAIRPAMRGGPARRALAAWFVLDETVGLALAEPAAAARTYVRAGWAFAAAWLAGTGLGVAGGAALGMAALAAAVFPVLFIGLAAIMARTSGLMVRAGIAAVATLLLLLAWPGLRGLAPLLAALAASLGGRGVPEPAPAQPDEHAGDPRDPAGGER